MNVNLKCDVCLVENWQQCAVMKPTPSHFGALHSSPIFVYPSIQFSGDMKRNWSLVLKVHH